jgi:chromate transporter
MYKNSDKTITKNSDGFWSVFLTFLKLGLTSFGGPIAHIGYFHKVFVEQKRWLTESTFSQLLAISQFIPGPASSQLGFAIGLVRAGWLGAIAAFIAFTLPSALILIAFASTLHLFSGELFNAIIHGLKLVACAVVSDAVLSMSKKLCFDMKTRTITLIAVCALLMFEHPLIQISIILIGAFAGIACCRKSIAISSNQINIPFGQRTSIGLLIVFGALFLLLLLMPLHSNLFTLAKTFYSAGSLVFGGGHVVLPLLEDAVVTNGIVTQADFLAGYGASQAIPGPMFAFAAYIGAIIPTGYNLWFGAVFALVFMFLPGFLLLTAALPFWQNLATKPIVANAITGINATVVGILAVALYDPIITVSINNNIDLVIAIVAFAIISIWRRSPLWAVIWCMSAVTLPVIFT